MATAPWIASDELCELVEPLLPVKERRFRYPGRTRLPDRPALQGILFVLHTGIAWQHLPSELGFGSGVTCWRRLDGYDDEGAGGATVSRGHRLLEGCSQRSGFSCSLACAAVTCDQRSTRSCVRDVVGDDRARPRTARSIGRPAHGPIGQALRGAASASRRERGVTESRSDGVSL